jgi:2-iminobutanoate/2-iminopropanoate deaminase
VRAGDVLFLSGVIGRSAAGEIGEATRQSLTSIQSQLEGLGASMSDVVKCTVYLVNIDHYAGMNEVYVTFFPTEPPARTAIAVQALPGSALVEVDCIAAADAVR